MADKKSKKSSKTDTAIRLVVGVGASAGGLEAFSALLKAISDVRGMTYLLVQHLDPTHQSLLADILARKTTLSVVEADHGAELEADTVYIIRPDTAMAVEEGKIVLTVPQLKHGVRLPVDHLFRSLAREFGTRSVGIVLSGAGSDGSAGVRDIHNAGGFTVAQNPRACSQAGMPQSAISTGSIDLVLDIDDMPDALERFDKMPPETRAVPSQVDEPLHEESSELSVPFSEKRLSRLAALLEAHSRFDLRVYKEATISRRARRRMLLAGIGDFNDYVKELENSQSERNALQRDLLISVTDFFRNPDAFVVLQRGAIASIVANKLPGETIRVWVPGCATGEEAYSIAIEFLDAIDAQEKHLGLQIFATDLDSEALAVARGGIYPSSISEQISSDRLRNYFEEDSRGYHVRAALRDRISFALHDLTKDPPFFRMDLISCRNLLIYLRRDTQENVLNGLHFALMPEGYLFLGSAETVGNLKNLFETDSKKWRVYKKVGSARPVPFIAPSQVTERKHSPESGNQFFKKNSRDDGSEDLVRRSVIEARVAPTVVISADGDIIFMHGELRPFLRFPAGEKPQLNIASMVTPELATRTRGTVYSCRKESRTVTALANAGPDLTSPVRITASPCADLHDGAVILTFEVADEEAPATPPDIDDSHVEVVRQLENELRATQEDLRTTIEELETANEELRASGEEATSMNEELQSANEELEATTEELRSLNEELTTVNAELREKIEQVQQSHDDLSNLMSSTKIATLFLDEKLNIKRFTPAAEELLNLDKNSLGQFIGDVAREAMQNELQDEAAAVLEDFSTRTRELRTASGLRLSRQVLPYRSSDRRIEGVVVTFVDITEIKEASDQLAIRQRQNAAVAQLGLHALQNSDLQNFLEKTMRVMQQVLDVDFVKILELQPGGKDLFLRAGRGWHDGITGQATVGTGLESQAGYTLKASEAIIVDDLETEARFSAPPILSDHEVVSGISCPIRYGDGVYGVVGAHTVEQRSFTQEDANFVQALAAIIGNAVSQEQTRIRMAVEADVAAVLAKSLPLDETFAKTLEAILKTVEGGVGELWWPTGESNELVCRHLVVDARLDRKAVQQKFSSCTFKPGVGLVGRVFSTASAIWLTEFADPVVFVRHEEAGKLGLKAAVAFPIVAGAEVLGVLAVYSHRRFFANSSLLSSFESLGRFIGDYIDRTDIENRIHNLAAIAESSHDAILSYDEAGEIRDWLGGAEALYGYSANEIVGKSMTPLIPESHREEFQAVIKRIRDGEVIEPFDTTRIRKDGHSIEVSSRCAPIRNKAGDLIAISATDRDVTGQKITERRLRDADQQKDQFLAMLGHELRNPLAALHSGAALLKVSDGDQKIVERTQKIIERQTSHMSKLLDGLLDISRIVQGQITLDRKVVDLAAICHQVYADVEDRAREHKLRLSKMIPSEPVYVEGDSVRLTQVIENLLTNAINYSESGDSIVLELRTKSGNAELRVVDTGIGIDADFMPHIFEVFRQGDRSLDRSQGGLGIGLALVKTLVERHHGQVEVSSGGVGKGADFTVRLPLSHEKPRPAAEDAVAPAAGLTILLIEDNEDSAEMQKAVLTMLGHQVWVAPNGPEGIQMARHKLPDVVFCDLGLPKGMTGFDVAKALADDTGTGSIPLVALSGYGSPADKRKAIDSGFVKHLTKPVDVQTLQQVIAELSRESATS